MGKNKKIRARDEAHADKLCLAGHTNVYLNGVRWVVRVRSTPLKTAPEWSKVRVALHEWLRKYAEYYDAEEADQWAACTTEQVLENVGALLVEAAGRGFSLSCNHLNAYCQDPVSALFDEVRASRAEVPIEEQVRRVVEPG